MASKRLCWVPTLRGWLLLLAVCLGSFLLVLFTIHPFLAVSNGRPGGALVVEGWTSDQVFAAVVSEFKSNRYDRLYVTGGPLEAGAPLAEYQTYAQRGAAILTKMGVETNSIQPVAAPRVIQDRTFTSAVTLKRWMQEHSVNTTNIHLYTEGPHARRSWLMFQRAFGKQYRVTVTSAMTLGYDPKRWWASSSGFRTVVGEAVAYFYVRLLFHPGEPAPD